MWARCLCCRDPHLFGIDTEFGGAGLTQRDRYCACSIRVVTIIELHFYYAGAEQVADAEITLDRESPHRTRAQAPIIFGSTTQRRMATLSVIEGAW
jgi:hypothetical protein